jgi:hypothetical protein
MALCLLLENQPRASYAKEVRVCLAESWKQSLRFTALPRVSHEAVDLMQRSGYSVSRLGSVCLSVGVRAQSIVILTFGLRSPCHSAFPFAAACVTRSSRSKQLLCEPEDRLGSMYLSVGVLAQSIILTLGLRSI